MSNPNNLSSTGVDLCLRWVWSTNHWVEYSQEALQNLVETRAAGSARDTQAGMFEHLAGQCCATYWHQVFWINICWRLWPMQPQRKPAASNHLARRYGEKQSHVGPCKIRRRSENQSNFFWVSGLMITQRRWGLQRVCQVASPCAICRALTKTMLYLCQVNQAVRGSSMGSFWYQLQRSVWSLS